MNENLPQILYECRSSGYLSRDVARIAVNTYYSFESSQVVSLDSAVDPESTSNKGNVERWLLELEALQWQSVRTKVIQSLEEYPKITRNKWVLNWPAQAVLGVSQVRIVPNAVVTKINSSFHSKPLLCETAPEERRKHEGCQVVHILWPHLEYSARRSD